MKIPVGIINHMNNCYINCALQILLNLPDINNELIFRLANYRGEIDCKHFSLVKRYLELFIKTETGAVRGSGPLDIDRFYRSLCNEGIVSIGKQGDYHESLLLICDRLTCIQKIIGCVPTFDDIMMGELCKTILCSECNKSHKLKEPFSTVQLIKSLDHSFDVLQANFVTDNYKCEHCGKTTTAQISTVIKKLPLLLILHRPQIDSEHIEIEPNLRFHTSSSEHYYSIYGTVHHRGSQSNGHYYIQLFLDSKIYLINDTTVTTRDQPETNNIVSKIYWGDSLSP